MSPLLTINIVTIGPLAISFSDNYKGPVSGRKNLVIQKKIARNKTFTFYGRHFRVE